MEQRGNRSQQTFGLTQRLMKYQAKREAGLDSDRRIYWLAAAFSGGRGMPGLDRFFGSKP